MTRFPGSIGPWMAAAMGLVFFPVWALPPARAELPPWVYAEEQRQAPLVVELLVSSVEAGASDVVVQARVLRVQRQPSSLQLRPDDALQIRYARPPQRPEGWVGPSPLPLLHSGERRTAWLQPDPQAPGVWAPAAGGRSFGPSLEDLPGS